MTAPRKGQKERRKRSFGYWLSIHKHFMSVKKFNEREREREKEKKR